MQILFLKAGPIKNGMGLHQEDRTDRTGRHQKRWVRGAEAKPEPRQAKAQDPEDARGAAHGYGTHNIEHGDTVAFNAAGVQGSGKVVASGKDGATVKDDTGKEHSVYWHEVSGHEPANSRRVEVPPAKVLGKQEPIPAEQFKATDYAKSHDEADVSEDKILDQFPPDTRGKIAAAKERLASIEQTIDQHKHNGTWDEDRTRLHDLILKTGGIQYRDEEGNEKTSEGIFSDARIQAATPPEGQAPTMIILGGRGGSGKSSFKGTVYDPAKFIVLDADAIKQLMPEYEGWNAHQVHEESGEIFDKAVEIARELGLNVVLDKTMKTAKSAIADVKAFKDAGFRVEAHYMHLPRQEAAKRAVGRFINGGNTGRYVPPGVVLSNTTNEDSFDQVRPLVDAWSFRDNNVPKGAKPILISRGGDATGAGKEFHNGGQTMAKAQGRAILIARKGV